MKTYLKDGDITYCIGAKLEWDLVEHKWRVWSIEDDNYFDGQLVNYDDINNNYYIGDDEDE